MPTLPRADPEAERSRLARQHGAPPEGTTPSIRSPSFLTTYGNEPIFPHRWKGATPLSRQVSHVRAIGLCALAALAPSAASAAVASADDAPLHASLILEASRVAGVDPSPALRLPRLPSDLAPLAARPIVRGTFQLSASEPAVRVHVRRGDGFDDPDTDLDGVPDRGRLVLDAAVETLALCARLGLGRPADDGDAELDVFVLPLAGAVRGYAALERPDLPGRGASGFVVVDGSTSWTRQELRAIVARSVARLVLAARDADAPAWWTEPSAVWIESQVAGTPLDADRMLRTRWNHAETGLRSNDPLLARGNAGLLWSLDDAPLEGRLVAATWRRLARRSLGATAESAIAEALRQVTGLSLRELYLRGAISQIVGGAPPERWSIDVGDLPVLQREGVFPVASLGAAFVRLTPDASEPEGTRLTLGSADGAWTSRLLVKRRDGGWEMVTIEPFAGDADPIVVPWADYTEAVAVFVRPEETGPGRIEAEARTASGFEPFALSSFEGRLTPAGTVEIGWSSAWERELYGWLVERAPTPSGPWETLTPFPVPALGLPREGTGYTLVDPWPGDDGPLHYRVVGVTTHGLRASGPAFVVR